MCQFCGHQSFLIGWPAAPIRNSRIPPFVAWGFIHLWMLAEQIVPANCARKTNCGILKFWMRWKHWNKHCMTCWLWARGGIKNAVLELHPRAGMWKPTHAKLTLLLSDGKVLWLTVAGWLAPGSERHS